MTKKILAAVPLAVLGATLSADALADSYRSERVVTTTVTVPAAAPAYVEVVPTAPPPAQIVVQRSSPSTAYVEVAPAPRPGYVWVPGYWNRLSARKEIWVPGYWQVAPAVSVVTTRETLEPRNQAYYLDRDARQIAPSDDE